MGVIKKLNKWANRHTYYPLDLIRIGLGILLLYKGFHFMGNTQILIDLIKPIQNIAGSMIAIHYVTPAHIIGGLLIIFGLLTRWATLAQLPLILGAVIINFAGEMNTTNLIISIITLILCLFFTVYGSGKHSVDYYLKMQQ